MVDKTLNLTLVKSADRGEQETGWQIPPTFNETETKHAGRLKLGNNWKQA